METLPLPIEQPQPVGRPEIMVDTTPQTQKDGTETDSTTEESSCHTKSVDFDTIRIYEFTVGLGDNPSVRDGPPVCLHDYQQEYKVSVEDYEAHKPQSRSMDEMRMDRAHRHSVLDNVEAAGLRKHMCEVNRIKHQRRASYAMAEYESVQMVVERLSRSWRKFRTRREPKCAAHQWNVSYKEQQKKAQQRRNKDASIHTQITAETDCSDL